MAIKVIHNLKRRIEKKLSVQKLPKSVLLLITSPRSGSTWLFDTLRSHPAIYMLPEGIIFEVLSLKGRRYPRDLSDGPKASLKVEVRPDWEDNPKKWAKVPDFVIPFKEKKVPEKVTKTAYAIEKIHPNFFNYNIKNFLKDATIFSIIAKVRLIYQIRDPKAALESFFRYQERNPTWYANRGVEEVVCHMNQTYQTILEMIKKRPGLIIDYRDIENDFQETIFRIFEYLWPREMSLLDNNTINLIKEMKASTDRKKRSSQSPFLGKRKGLITGGRGEFENIFLDYKQEIDCCYQAYHSLLKLKSKQQHTF